MPLLKKKKNKRLNFLLKTKKQGHRYLLKKKKKKKNEKKLLEKQDFAEHWTEPSAIHVHVLQLSPLSNTSPLIQPSPRYTQSIKEYTKVYIYKVISYFYLILAFQMIFYLKHADFDSSHFSLKKCCSKHNLIKFDKRHSFINTKCKQVIYRFSHLVCIVCWYTLKLPHPRMCMYYIHCGSNYPPRIVYP